MSSLKGQLQPQNDADDRNKIRECTIDCEVANATTIEVCQKNDTNTGRHDGFYLAYGALFFVQAQKRDE